MSETITNIVEQISDFVGGDITALLILFVTAYFTINTAKNAFKIAGSIIGLMAILYMLDPTIYARALEVVNEMVVFFLDFVKGNA